MIVQTGKSFGGALYLNCNSHDSGSTSISLNRAHPRVRKNLITKWIAVAVIGYRNPVPGTDAVAKSAA